MSSSVTYLQVTQLHCPIPDMDSKSNSRRYREMILNNTNENGNIETLEVRV